MDELQQAMHKFERENDHLIRMMEMVDYGLAVNAYVANLELILAQAKRVRNTSTVLVRTLAQERDTKLQPNKEGTSE